jgi:hypothetical protein
MAGFFSGSTAIKKSLPMLPACGPCGLRKHCKAPVQTYQGKPKPIAIVVGATLVDDKDGIQKSDYSRLKSTLKQCGRDIDEFAVVAAQACVGESKTAWKHCQPHMIRELKRLNPTTIIPFGNTAVSSVCGRLWETAAETQNRFFGQNIPSTTLNAWVCPVGPVGIFKGNGNATSMWTYRHLKRALEHSERPFEVVPDYQKLVRVLYDREEIFNALASICGGDDTGRADIASFDYETTGLKPEADGHEIVTVSIAWMKNGKIDCIAFPFYPEIREAFIAFLLSPVRKTAANMKYEARWSRKMLGVEVNRWYWDSVIGAHIEDPQRGVTSLKFQAFVKLGVPYWAKDLDGNLESEGGGNSMNKIHQIPMPTLLVYNGLDSLYELLVGSIQMKEAGLIQRHFVPEYLLPREV